MKILYSVVVFGILWIGALVNTYADVSSGLKAADTLAGKGIIVKQDSASGYKLDSDITRKEIMKVVMKISGKSIVDECNGKFGDVMDDWGCKYIETALSEFFIAKNTNFRPDDSITKAESMKLIFKAKGLKKTHDTGDWRNDYMLTALDLNIISKKYTDYNSKATREWIFLAAVFGNNDTASDSTLDTSETTEEIIGDETDLGDEDTTDLLDELLAGLTDENINPETGYKSYDTSLMGVNTTTVLFFHASWCPSCIGADKSLNGEDFISQDILILKVDYDNSAKLKEKYGVTTQHTFVQIDESGKLLKKWLGSKNLEDIQNQLQ